jgi:hypothetical protein
MGQFDFPSAGALSRVKSENASSSPVDGVVEKAANIGGMVLEAIGFRGASVGVPFLTSLKSLAAGKDEANLIYFGKALVDDLARLYSAYEKLKQEFDDRIQSPEFNAAVANATLYITRTNVEARLRRVANLIANGVRENDLELESLDDMMRTAVELQDRDISTLDKMFRSQAGLLGESFAVSSEWSAQVAPTWNNDFSLSDGEHLGIRASLARLQSLGMIAEVRTMMTPSGSLSHQPFGLLPGGKKFCERLRQLAEPSVR